MRQASEGGEVSRATPARRKRLKAASLTEDIPLGPLTPVWNPLRPVTSIAALRNTAFHVRP